MLDLEEKKLIHQWYIVQCVSNNVEKVKEALENKRITENMENLISEVFLPKKVHVTKSGSKKRKPIFPGYIFIKMAMTNEAWFIIRNTQDVTGIVGSSGQRTKPTPIPQSQINKIINQVNKFHESEIEKKVDTTNVDYVRVEKNIIVEIIDGPWNGQKGKVLFQDANGIVQLEIETFGRMMKISIPGNFIKKLS